jgi:hypothetical protein
MISSRDIVKPKVFLHIGHPKTGSSAFQASLAKSHELLATRGILYPYHRSFKLASQNHISSGNLSIGAEDQNWLTTEIEPVLNANTSYHTFIFSNENLIHRLSDFTSCIDQLRDSWDFHILLVVRNPIEQLGSVYQQLVKRHGYSKGYEDFLLDYEYQCNATHKSAAALEQLEAHNITYSLFNYSILKDEVIEALAAAIGIDRGITDCSSKAPVNRSLSTTELQLLLFVNAIYGRDVGRQLADSLVNQLPEVEAVSLAMKTDSWHKVVRANQASLDKINQRLTASNQLSFATEAGFLGDLHCNLSASQLHIGRTILNDASRKELMDEANFSGESGSSHSTQANWSQQVARLMSITSRILEQMQPATKSDR